MLVASWVAFGVIRADRRQRALGRGLTRRRDHSDGLRAVAAILVGGAPARLRRDALRRLPAAPARPRRPGPGRRLVVPRRLLHRRRRLHELDLAAHRRRGSYEQATSTSTTPRPRGRSRRASSRRSRTSSQHAGGNTGRSGPPPLDRLVARRQPRARAPRRPARRRDARRPDLHQERDRGAQPGDPRPRRAGVTRSVTTSLEHNSVMRPLRDLERAGRCSVEIVRADGNTGEIDLDEWAARLDAARRRAWRSRRTRRT